MVQLIKDNTALVLFDRYGHACFEKIGQDMTQSIYRELSESQKAKKKVAAFVKKEASVIQVCIVYNAIFHKLTLYVHF
jgi:hypothetical protein